MALTKTLWDRSEIVANARKFLRASTGKDDGDDAFERGGVRGRQSDRQADTRHGRLRSGAVESQEEM